VKDVESDVARGLMDADTGPEEASATRSSLSIWRC